MNMLDAYASIAEFYDLEHDSLVEDVAFYRQYVETAGDPVLELACGTGRVAVPIAADGYRVVGADRSEPMLAGARRRADEAGVELTLLNAEMVDARSMPGGPFGVVILALGALSHIETADGQLEALTSARQALDPRGVLLIDIMHATPSRLQTLDGSYGFDGSWRSADGSAVHRFSSSSVHPATQTIESHIWYDRTSVTGGITRHATSMTQRYLTPGELLLMLEVAGFEEVALYGGYELDPFADDSERLIVAAEATRTR
ncbi:MAG: class I SAM-dependent methyltransferase [Thermomicrobiales bacterium]